jgi:hypothetical protein
MLCDLATPLLLIYKLTKDIQKYWTLPMYIYSICLLWLGGRKRNTDSPVDSTVNKVHKKSREIGGLSKKIGDFEYNCV